jgi:hypothetical protein
VVVFAYLVRIDGASRWSADGAIGLLCDFSRTLWPALFCLTARQWPTVKTVQFDRCRQKPQGSTESDHDRLRENVCVIRFILVFHLGSRTFRPFVGSARSCAARAKRLAIFKNRRIGHFFATTSLEWSAAKLIISILSISASQL